MWCGQAFSFTVFENIEQGKINFSYLLLSLLKQFIFLRLCFNTRERDVTTNSSQLFFIYDTCFWLGYGKMQNKGENIAWYTTPELQFVCDL